MANGYSDLSYEPGVAYFVRRVRELSHGAVRIHVVSDWRVRNGSPSPDFEQLVVRDVAGGKADLGWVGTRIFDTLGVRSFQALTAPMLIDSYPLERAVIESPIPQRMLAGLAPLGVTGLAVLADGLRKPMAVRAPLLAPADWRGLTFAAFRSRGQFDAIRALGATPTGLWSSPLTNAMLHHRVQGFEKSLLVYQINGMQTIARFVTANVNLWPQTAALIANPDSLSRLSPQQRAWLDQAAADAAVRSTRLADADAALAPIVCRDGARLVDASPSDLAAMRRAFAPVYATLVRDPETRAFVAAIRRLKASTPADPLRVPAGCSGSKRATSLPALAAPAPGAASATLEGTYRISWTEKQLLAAGASPSFAVHNHYVVTMTMRDGRFVWHLPPPPCTGVYTVSGDTVSFRFTDSCTGSIEARWSLAGGRLHLRLVRASDLGTGIQFTAKPWRKIG